MTDLLDLWMPMLVSAVIVFIASSIIHMGPFWHKNDYPAVPDEGGVMDALRPFNIAPGDYMMPRCGAGAEMKSPEYMEKLKRGPVMLMTVLPNGVWSMGSSLVRWFIFCVVVSVFAGYVTSRALGPGADYLRVFQIAGATAFIGYSLALWPMWIWCSRGLGLTIKGTIDGLIYGCLTAGTFGWLWPKIMVVGS